MDWIRVAQDTESMLGFEDMDWIKIVQSMLGFEDMDWIEVAQDSGVYIKF